VKIGGLDLGRRPSRWAGQVVAAVGHAVALRAEVTDRDAMSKAVDTLVGEFGRQHIPLTTPV
jgi:NAD(P)-dependent dehydrogenase (short-subunit alcohol dehydrogenase family)